MKNLKKSLILITIASLFLLTGCFEGEETVVDSGEELQNFKTYTAPSFSVGIPNQWEIIEPKDFSSDIPSETQVIFRDNIKSDIFTPNANVAKVLLGQQTSSYDFARNEISKNRNSLLNYNEISRDEEFNIVIGGQMTKTVLILFEGKLGEADPKVRMTQVFAVNGADAYSVTAAYRADSSELVSTAAKNIVKSFKIK
jgi:hypothetical protein